MCVIVIKPAGTDISAHNLSGMFEANSDGAGLAFISNNSIKVEKGFFSLKKLKKRLKQLTDVELVLHFRYATHGIINKAQTHPFVISKNTWTAKCKQATPQVHSVLFHNGIISDYGTKTYSDTLQFVTSTLAHVKTTQAKLNVLELTDCKYALLDKSGIYTVGKFEEFAGLQCSNLHWQYNYIYSVPNTSCDSQSVYADYYENLKTFEMQFTGRRHGSPTEHHHIEYIDAVDVDDAMEYLQDSYADIKHLTAAEM